MSLDFDIKSLYRKAYVLALITLFYNCIEGAVSLYFGLKDDTIALFGFGLDSFVEVLSGMGVWHMIRRIHRDPSSHPDRFEKRALTITGMSFYLLSGGLIITAGINAYSGHKPETTFWGIVVSLVSIATMWLLIRYKVIVGKRLNSEAILADATCTKTCLYLSIVLLIASAGYALTRIGGFDIAGSLCIAMLSFREGRESFQKAREKRCSCSCEMRE